MQNITKQTITTSPGIGLRWALANFAAVVLAILAVLPAAVNLAYASQPAWLRGLVAGAVLGLALGSVQWWVLRRPFAVSALWIVISLLCGAIGVAVGMQAAEFIPHTAVTEPLSRTRASGFATGTALGAATSGLLYGLVLGWGQWLLLRQSIPNAAWWIVANAGGWAASLGLAALLTAPLGWLLLAGSINGVITGWLLNYWVNNNNWVLRKS